MLTAMQEISNSDDMIDVRDIIERVEELELVDGIEEQINSLEESGDATDLVTLRELLDALKGYGGDHQWRGDWYPIMLIRDTYFKDYAQELAEDIGAINADATWPNSCIDWDQATYELQQDYSTVSFDGVTYWYR